MGLAGVGRAKHRATLGLVNYLNHMRKMAICVVVASRISMRLARNCLDLAKNVTRSRCFNLTLTICLHKHVWQKSAFPAS
jgi:hypothetical protein